jgi:predicted transcriptional regulator
MNDNILISLEPRHAKNILAGVKRVELRTRAPRVAPGTIVWMYSKRPEGSVVGCAMVKSIAEGSPSALWRKFRVSAGVSRTEFREYFSGRSVAFAIELTSTRSLSNPISLDLLRGLDANFHPPQFFKKLTLGTPVADLLVEAS